MYEIVNEPNLTIAFDMDTELSQFGVFGVYIKQGYNICAGYIDPSDWSGIHKGYKELVELYENCKGTATFTYVLTGEGDTLTFSLDQKGALTMEINICTIYNYKCNMTIESLDQTYLPRFIEFLSYNPNFSENFWKESRNKKSRVFKMRLFFCTQFLYTIIF